jgi:hypothetical protein
MTEAEGLGILRKRLPAVIGARLGALVRHNRRLWNLEEQVRAAADAEEVARLRREQERARGARLAAVAAIDDAVLARWRRGRAPGDRGAVLDSASVGHQLNRLAILVIRRARAVGPTAHAIASAQWDHAFACLDRALVALAAGTWVHHPRDFRQYGARTTPRAATPRAATTRSGAERRSRRAGPRAGSRSRG